ncbi:MAG TPA: ThuA domain-containing protein [Chloroflexi bacterium]|nr:ThuA domain-containing protein [Chloroflexota bacterium]
MEPKRALLLLGGSWHDFDGFAAWLSGLLTPRGWQVEATYDLDRLLVLEEEKPDLVISYTCFSANPDPQNARGSHRMKNKQAKSLANWVHSGGAFYGVHGATVMGESAPLLGKLLGGRFLHHPPAFTYKVYPMFEEHDFTQKIDAFEVTEEFYIQHYDNNLDILMVGILDEVVHPLVWCKHEGLGRVAYNALGHVPEVWQHPTYQRLTLQAVDWLLAWIQE